MLVLVCIVLCVLVIVLGIEEDFFDCCFEQLVSVFCLIYYLLVLVWQSVDQFGVGVYIDYGCVILFYQDVVGGL